MHFAQYFIVMLALASSTACNNVTSQGREASKLADLESRLERLEAAQRSEEQLKDREAVAYLTPGADGYSVLRADLGYLTFKLDDIQPYENGSRVALRVGNLTGATINGARAKLEWGTLDSTGSPEKASVRERDVEFMASLRPGSWTIVPLVLEGVAPAQLGFVRVRDVTHRSISLTQD